MRSGSASAAKTTSDTPSPTQPVAPPISEDELHQMLQRAEGMQRRPHSGKLARKLRRRRGLSGEDVGDDLGGEHKTVRAL